MVAVARSTPETGIRNATHSGATLKASALITEISKSKEQHVTVRVEASLDSRPIGQSARSEDGECPTEGRTSDDQERTLCQQLPKEMRFFCANCHS